MISRESCKVKREKERKRGFKEGGMGERYLERGREGITSPHHRITTTTIIIKIKKYISL